MSFVRVENIKGVYLLSFFALRIIVGQATLRVGGNQKFASYVTRFHFKTFAFVDFCLLSALMGGDFDALCTEWESRRKSLASLIAFVATLGATYSLSSE